MMKPRILLCFLLLILPSIGRAQQVAFSFDDGLDPRSEPLAAEWNAAILASLSKANIKSILYATGNRVESQEGISLVSDWGESGHSIANHTYTHLSFSSDKTSVDAFIADVEKNEKLLEHLPGWTKRLRFPYLKEGRSAEKRDEFRKWMKVHEYATGAVSIDASDWYYNSRYLEWKAKHPEVDPAPFRDAYLAHLWTRASYYEALAKTIRKRSVSHVILLHTNAINAAFLSDVIAMFKAKGWTIVSPEVAYQDSVYSEVPQTLPAGESLLWSLAKQDEVADLRYPAEDARYEKSILDGLGL